MSNGGGSQNRSKRRGGAPPSGAADDFGRAVSKIAVAQICESVGFHSSHRSALDALADVAIRYISDLGKAANFYAALSCRSDCNAFDVIQGLEDLGSPHGFVGASDGQRCLVSSGIVREVTDYIGSAEEVPFPRSIPGFPIVRSANDRPGFTQVGESPTGKHIPGWLPPFPNPHTYIHTAVWNEKTTDPRADKLEQARQRRKAEKSLLSLQQRLASSNASGFITENSSINGGTGRGMEAAVSNPFLAPPLPYGEKEVLEVIVHNDFASAKRPSVLEAFTPAIEAAKGGSTFDSGVGEKRVLPNGRPKVHFKFGVDKKSVAVPLSSSALGVRSDSWVLRDDEKDDKKRRAEMILKEAMENPEELNQL